MDSIPRRARDLRPGDIITRHPEHPERAIHYRVTTWPQAISDGRVVFDYSTPPERAACGCQMSGGIGALNLPQDQLCQIIPARTQGGQA